MDNSTELYLAKKKGMLSFSISLSDYNLIKRAKDSSFSYALNKRIFSDSGNTSFGIYLSYWKGLNAYMDFFQAVWEDHFQVFLQDLSKMTVLD
jgi:hypothetical protein